MKEFWLASGGVLMAAAMLHFLMQILHCRKLSFWVTSTCLWMACTFAVAQAFDGNADIRLAVGFPIFTGLLTLAAVFGAWYVSKQKKDG